MARREAVSIASHKVSLPTIVIPPDTDHARVGREFITLLSSLQAADLTEEAYWRDLVSLTGTFRTFHTPARITAAWENLIHNQCACDFVPVPNGTSIDRNTVRAKFTFRTLSPESRPALCSGFMNIVLVGKGEWKIWVLCTMIEQVEGWPDVDVLTQTQSPSRYTGTAQSLSPLQAVNGHEENVSGQEEKVNGHEEKANDASRDKVDVDCVVVGTGHAGLCLLGRLHVLGVSALGIERNASVGDSWTNRYKNLKLHTPKDYSELPFGRWYGKDTPYYPEAKDIAVAYRQYAKACQLNIWCSAHVEAASWNASTRVWTVRVTSGGKDHKVTARHVVFAIAGTGQEPSMPVYPDRHEYKGTTMHSIEWSTGDAWAGKRGIVIGTGSTGHDVAKAMVEGGLSEVTMIQRNVTPYFLEEYCRTIFDPIYDGHSDIGQADRVSTPVPAPIARVQSMAGIQALAEKYSERFDELEKTNLKIARCFDMQHQFFERQGGQYVDNQSTSRMIVDGRIRVRSGVLPTRFTETGLRMADGSTIEADLIVFCTGFNGNMRTRVARMVGPEIADQLDDYFCFDAEGEVRGNWKPIGHPAIWYAGGTMAHSRFFSRFMALQIKADIERVPFVPYRENFPEVV